MYTCLLFFFSRVTSDTSPDQVSHRSPQAGGKWDSGLPFVRDNNHNCRLWTAHSEACLPQTNQPQSVACLVGSRLVGIDPHPVRGLMMWSWICEVTLWWMLTTQSIWLASNTSLSLVEGQRTLVIEHTCSSTRTGLV